MGENLPPRQYKSIATEESFFLSLTRFKFVLLIWALFVVPLAILASYRTSLIPPNPLGQMLKTTLRLIETGNLCGAEYKEIFHDLVALSAKFPEVSYIEDVFAVGKGGILCPKHSALVSVLNLPFVQLFGVFGVEVFTALLLLVFCHCLVSEMAFVSSERVARILLPLFFVGTQTLKFSYGLSYDLLGGILVFIGFHFLRKHLFLGMLLIALSAGVRATNLIFVLLLPFAVNSARENYRNLLPLLLGAGFGLFPTFYLNYLLWGDPFDSAYQRLIYFKAGAVLPESMLHYFSFEVFCSKWFEKLWGSGVGLFFHNPALLVLFCCPFFRKELRQQRFIFGSFLAGLLNALVIFSYSQWFESSSGNRFLFPTIFLWMITVAAIVENIAPKWGKDRALRQG